MTQPLSALDTGALAPETLAVLLDFDGTVVGIAERPDALVLEERTAETLARFEEALGGALAIVTGRSIDDVDGFLRGRRFAVAGIHGLERRSRDGEMHFGLYDRASLEGIAEALERLADREPGLRLERKPGSVALHYRQRPELETRCREAAKEAVAQHPGATMLTGKMVVEVKLGGRTKADAVGDFMAEPPFEGRTPLYAGDDVTDEDAFRAVAERDGIAIKIGDGETVADYRAEDTESFLDWLEALSFRLDSRASAGEGR